MADYKKLKKDFEDMAKYTYDLQSAFMELSRTSNISEQELKDVQDTVFSLGKQVSKSSSEIIKTLTEFKRAGYEMQESLDMTEAALTMTNVAQNITDTSEAVRILTSVLKGFQMQASQSIDVVNKINHVSDTMHVSFDAIAEGLALTADTLGKSGTTIDEAIGLLTAGYLKLQDMDAVSEGLMSISARLQDISENSAVIKSFKEIGVSIDDAGGNLRSLYDIAKDYAAVLPTLSSEQKRYYSELAAGNEAAVWDSVTSQFDYAKDAVNQSANSQNSAVKENARLMDNLVGHVTQLKLAYEELCVTLADSDLLKFLVDLGTAGINVFQTLSEFLTPMGTLFAIGGKVLNDKNLGKIRMLLPICPL